MKYTKTIIKHLILALNSEIISLKEVSERVGDNWPSWFDINDIYLLEEMLKWLKNIKEEYPKDENIHSKGFGFMMKIVNNYVDKNIDNFTEQELREIMDFYKEYEKRNKF